MVLNDTHFNGSTLSEYERHNYDFFRYRNVPSTVSTFYDRVMALCSKRVIRDGMGTDRRVVDLYGYTPDDLMRFDFASFVDLEELIDKIEEDHDAEMREKTSQMEQAAATANKET